MPQFDTQCQTCGHEHVSLIQRPAGGFHPTQRIVEAHCPKCDDDTDHERFVSLPAPYMGEIVNNPRCFGGSFDTAGAAALPEMPAIESEMRYDPKVGRKVEAYKAEAISEVYQSKEGKEIRAERKEIKSRNKAKKHRDAAINRGENINFGKRQSDRLPGDPKFT